MGGRWADACHRAGHPQPPASHWAGGTGGQPGRGTAIRAQEAMHRGPFLLTATKENKRPLVTNRGSASRPGPRGVRAGTVGSFRLQAQGGIGCRAVGREWFGGLTRSAGEPEKEAHRGQGRWARLSV